MKFKTTQKEIRANYNKIICVPYCGLQTLLNYESPVAYTVRREGWAADIYDMSGGVAIVTGYKSKAKAGLGSAIVIVERGDWNGETYPLINIKAAIVDGEKIKADTWYTLKNGEFVECD